MDYVRTEVINDKFAYDENSDAFSEFQGAKLWPRRSLLYRISFLALLPLFGVFLLGFSSPFWMKKHQVDKYRGYYNLREKVDVSIGLWRVCEGTDFSDITDCTVIPDITSYIEVCQALLCLCMIFSVFSLVCGLYENCATRYDVDEGSEVPSKRPEMNAVMAGLFGLTGVSMYGATIIDAARNGEGAVHWAFPVTAASVTGLIVCGILMAIANPMHSTTQSFPGQIIDLSSQNSLRSREPTIQDRLVLSGESVPQVNVAQATTYGVTRSHLDVKNVSFLQRSDSCLSSHMSSPDLFSATSQELGLPHGHRSTHVVQAYDIHARTHDVTRKQWVKQQLQNKAGQRRSWHFDDRNGTHIFNDFMNSRPFTMPSSETQAHNEPEESNPAVPQRRDKLSPSATSNRPSKSPVLQVIPDETPDLLVLDDPIVNVPLKAEENLKTDTRTEDAHIAKRNTNPFLEENISTPAQMVSDLQRSTISSASWENQPWPDPPTESEILGQTALQVSVDSSSASESSVSNNPGPQLKILPESLQYQPQSLTTSPRKHGQGQDSKISYTTLKSSDTQTKSSKGNRTKPGRKSPGKKSPSPQENVPTIKEYDNPIFKSHSPDREPPGSLGESFAFQICESTSFVHPSPEESHPPPYFTIFGPMQTESASPRSRFSHQVFCHPSDTRGDTSQTAVQLCRDRNGDIPLLIFNRFGKRVVVDNAKKHSEFKEKLRSKPGRLQEQHQNGSVNSHPRLLKRENQHKRNGNSDVKRVQQQPSSPRIGLKGSNPDLPRKSPRIGQRKPVTASPGPVRELGDQKSGLRSKVSEQPSRHGSDVSRQYYKIQPGQYRQLGDSDL